MAHKSHKTCRLNARIEYTRMDRSRPVASRSHKDIMRLGRKLSLVPIVILIFFGAIMALDPRFVSHSELARKPLLTAFLFGPTIVFAVIAVVRFRKGQTWPAAAFAVGMMCTGLFHQTVVGASYGNPGYMFPGGHLIAPIVSLVAYLISFLGGWIIVRATQKIRQVISQKG